MLAMGYVKHCRFYKESNMHRFALGDYVQPVKSRTLPRNSVWIVRRYPSFYQHDVELDLVYDGGPKSFLPEDVKSGIFDDREFVKVAAIYGTLVDHGTVTERVSVNAGTPVTSSIGNELNDIREHAYKAVVQHALSEAGLASDADPVALADNVVSDAEAKLEAAKKLARKVREAAKAKAKAEAEAKRKAEAEKKAAEERQAISARLHKDSNLAAATVALIAELSRLHNGGAERVAEASIAAHAKQLQPLAKSYGYKIAKPGALAIVVKA